MSKELLSNCIRQKQKEHPGFFCFFFAAFRAGFVFQNIDYKLFRLSSGTSPSGFSPEVPAVRTLVSDLCVKLWSGCRTSTFLFFFFFLLNFLCCSFLQADQGAAKGSPRGWEIPAAKFSVHGDALQYTPTSMVRPSWELRPPCYPASQNTDSLFSVAYKVRQKLAAYKRKET